MKTNIGLTDRMIRLYAGMVIAGAGIFYNTPWALLGIPVFLSGIIGICPLYSMLGIKTFGKADQEI